MITHERLKELIEQKATIYWLDYHDIIEIKHFETCGLNGIYYYVQVNYLYEEDAEEIEYLDKKWVSVEDLFETKEDAEFHKEFKRIPRTDYLDLPTWEDFIEMEEFCFFSKNHKQIIIRILGTKYLGVETNFERYFTGDLTKENYTLACRKAKELFLGEE